ncbi:TRM11 family SAM-dependent methyltransferase [Streptomyces sp. NBC_01803]|uniref:TRM11 family SAM-dependent methyltransferase n=1 Tax=Streptomyces sp. NBC_01803 TaxID=2975946 RepID=UPI002DDABEA3|nr:SAM-dependent methyltransferase [Streptomyces sp. NBC_01803]WSA43345.1 SAM-dependent methyltransferase [Streptomyces sp. NBC_01803]
MLILPAANRVYAEASVELTQAELGVFSETVLGGQIGEIRDEEIGGVRYVTFSVPELSDRQKEFLANLSSIYALFGINENGTLTPVALTSMDRFDDDLISIQKYAGKTNEHFTKMLLNVTVLSSDSAEHMTGRTLRVFDPLCGRGTTLNQAIMYGYDADGMDRDRKDFEAYAAFLRTWLKRKRVKHTAEVASVRRDRKMIGRRLDVSLGLAKEDYKAGDKRRLTVVNADTLKAGDFFSASTFDVIVADAPYGVQHGSRGKEGGLSRHPLDLLQDALPVWTPLLRRGGAVGISWNTNVARRDDVVDIFTKNGLEVKDSGPYLRFGHRVDQAIVRDIIVARKP